MTDEPERTDVPTKPPFRLWRGKLWFWVLATAGAALDWWSKGAAFAEIPKDPSPKEVRSSKCSDSATISASKHVKLPSVCGSRDKNAATCRFFRGFPTPQHFWRRPLTRCS